MGRQDDPIAYGRDSNRFVVCGVLVWGAWENVGGLIDRNVGAHERLVEWEGKMIRLLTAGTRIWLVVAAMAVAVPMVAFAQTTEPAIESVPASDQPAVPNSSPTGDENSTDKDTSVQTEQPVAVEVKIQRRINELRSELLDDRASYIDRWLSVITIVLTFFSIVAVVLGYIGFRRFRKIEIEAHKPGALAGSTPLENSAETAKEHAAVAEKLVEAIEINQKRETKARGSFGTPANDSSDCHR